MVSGTSGIIWMLDILIFYNCIPNMYLAVHSNLMDRPNHLIGHLILCSVITVTLSSSFSSLLNMVYIRSKKTYQAPIINGQTIGITAGCCW